MAPRKNAKTSELPKAKTSGKTEVKAVPKKSEPKAKAPAKPVKPRGQAKKTDSAKVVTAPKNEKTASQPKPAKPRRGAKRNIPAPEGVPASKQAIDAAVAVNPEASKPASPAPQTGSALPPLVQNILEAIQKGRAVEFIFTDADSSPPRTFEPRQLIFDAFSKTWFVWGWDRRYNAERHHCVDLLAEVNAVEGVGRAAQGPFKEGTPANQIGGWLGGDAIPVKAVLLKQWIYAVKQAPAPFPEFKMEDMEEGKATVSFTGTDLRAIARWCMQFGDGIQVLEPQRLIDRIKQVGVTWAGKPKQEPEPPRPVPASIKPAAPRPEVKSEPRIEPKPEPRQDMPRKPQPQRFESPKETQDVEPTKKSGKIEIRFDRL